MTLVDLSWKLRAQKAEYQVKTLLEALRGMVLLFDDAREGCLLLQRADHRPITNGDQQVIDKAFIAAEAVLRKAKGE